MGDVSGGRGSIDEVSVSVMADNDAAGRPLNARSLALSVLLGSHPPALPASALVSLAGLFGIAPGTMRTALSRLVAGGEATVNGESRSGWYELAGDLLQRQQSQDSARLAPTAVWDNDWHTVIAADDQRTLAARRSFRSTMVNHRFGELRADIWIRPANAIAPTSPDWIVMTGGLAGRDPHVLTATLWDLPGLATAAERLVARLDRLSTELNWSTPASIPAAFTESARVVRFLRSEPQLPGELQPPSWPMAVLRSAYDAFERRHLQLLHDFLRTGSDE